MTTAPIEKAAMWLSEQKEIPQQVIHLLREKFGITEAHAGQLCMLAARHRQNRRSFL